MRQKTERHQDAAERTIKDIRRQTRKRYSSEEKIRIVLAGLRGEDSIERAQLLGLFISSTIAGKETRLFSEPGVFYVAADGTFYGAVINSFPFARPSVSDLIEVGSIVRERNYPPRGTWSQPE